MADMPLGERRQLAPPISDTGALGWIRKNLFSSWGNGITTVVLILAVAWLLKWFLNWAVFTATFTAPAGADCRGHGACWALIHEKYRYIFFGSFPYEQHWRPLFAVITVSTENSTTYSTTDHHPVHKMSAEAWSQLFYLHNKTTKIQPV